MTSHDEPRRDPQDDSGGDVVAEFELVDTQYLQPSDWQHLRRLREVIATGADESTARAVLAEIGGGPRNGMVTAIETEVKGLYGLDPSSRYRYVPKDRFGTLAHSRLRELVIARIDALQPGRCSVPEAVYRVDIHTIEFEGHLVRVREICFRSGSSTSARYARSPARTGTTWCSKPPRARLRTSPRSTTGRTP